jgi:RNA polymerase sigma-70 factor, ECF subfamily
LAAHQFNPPLRPAMNLPRKIQRPCVVYNGPMANSQAEFVRLLTQHSSQLFGFILALTANRADAEDVFQNTSVVLWEKFDAFEPGTSFYAWACRIAYFEALYQRRKTKRMKTISDEAWHALANHALAVSDAPDAGEQALADCLEKLPAADRDILEKKYYAKLSVAEIAAACSKSVHSIYRTLSRVHDQLLQCVRRKLTTE